MRSLTVETPAALPVPPNAIRLILVGCGGTGSCLAPILARLALHARSHAMDVDVLFVDGDTVEARNVGRQLFAPAEVGNNKARALAERLNAALGLDIGAVPQYADSRLLNELSMGRQSTVLLGAVDRADGRRAMAQALETNADYWLDLGNTDRAGQLVLGTAVNKRKLAGALDLPGLCRALPAASLIYPDLLIDEPAPALDCAAAVAVNAQSLLINQLMASVAGEYLYQLIIERRITRYRSVLDARSLSLSSQAITLANLSADLPGIPWQTEKTTKKRKRAA